ncbi:MAG: ribulose-phosphate 3-epimerase [Candidatus Kerfeldbacteria bacterium]|nr:ribulose-phosphate 3-epimerase [Candidatus Kerfeldbacteria bacterium]
MIQVVPAILEKTEEAIREKVSLLKGIADFVQLDVMDGQFVSNTTFLDASRLADLPVTMEVHLMIERPVFHLDAWALPNVSRMIVHYEALDNVSHTISHIRKLGKQVGIAINPGTSTFDIKEYLNDLDLVVVMGVEPGFSGQQFQRDVLEKVKEIKKIRPDMLIEVDGGVNSYTRNNIVNAGADILAAASFLWKAPDLKQAIADLRDGIQK